MYVCVLCMPDQWRVWNALKLGLQMIVSHFVDAGNWACVFCVSSKCSYSLGHLYSPKPQGLQWFISSSNSPCPKSPITSPSRIINCVPSVHKFTDSWELIQIATLGSQPRRDSHLWPSLSREWVAAMFSSEKLWDLHLPRDQFIHSPLSPDGAS